MTMHDDRRWMEHRIVPLGAPASDGWWAADPAGTILPSLPATWQCDLVTEELRWSGGVFDLFGIPRGAAIDRRSTLEFYTTESREMLEHLRGRALAECGSFTFEAQIRRHSGELRWMRLSADVQKRNGKAVTLYGTKQDITAEMASS